MPPRHPPPAIRSRHSHPGPRTFQASRAVIDWLRTTAFPEEAGYAKIRIARDNERMYGIRNPVGGVNEVAARPRTVESCRGDNPWAVVVDEIAFVKKDWFYRFLQPLTQVRERRFTCESTAPVFFFSRPPRTAPPRTAPHHLIQAPSRRHHNAAPRGHLVLRGH